MAKSKSRAARKGGEGSQALCPCGSGLPLAQCCGRWLSGGSEPFAAPTPEALMRSRYTAYALGDDSYVLGTWAPETRPEALFEPGEMRPKWMKLTVLESSVAPDGLAGEVTFRATARTSRGAMVMSERSHFRREADGRWLYVDGEDPEGSVKPEG